MNRLKWLSPLIILSLIGCASLAARNRILDFEKIGNAYRQAVRLSDFWAAYQFINPTEAKEKFDPDRYKDIRVVKYEVVNTDISENQLMIKQHVQIEYYTTDRGIVKTIQDRQIWTYSPKRDVWQLQNGLPDFFRK